jgi:hypothetical protein
MSALCKLARVRRSLATSEGHAAMILVTGHGFDDLTILAII